MNLDPKQDELGRFSNESRSLTPIERFCKYIEVSEDGCWLWTGYVNPDGYGAFGFNGKTQPAHRVSYELFYSSIPGSMVVHHRCCNRRCVNPRHLEIRTRRENVLLGTSPSALAAKKTHCPQGHPYSGDNLVFASNGGRVCLICRRAAGRRHMAKKRRDS